MADEIRFSDELINQMLQVSSKEMSHKACTNRVAFDARGTLHVQGLDEEHQVVDDITFSNNVNDYKKVDNVEYVDKINNLRKSNKNKNNILYILGLPIIGLTVFVVWFLWYWTNYMV